MPKVSGAQVAKGTAFDPNGSGLTSTNVNDAITEVSGKIWYREVLRLESPFTSTSSTYAAVTGLTSSLLPAGTYKFHFYGIAQSTSATRGVGIKLNQGSTGSLTYIFATWNLPHNGDGTDKWFQYDQTSVADNVVSANFNIANIDEVAYGTGIFKIAGDVGTTGNVQIEFRVETSGTAGSLKFPSTLIIERIS